MQRPKKAQDIKRVVGLLTMWNVKFSSRKMFQVCLEMYRQGATDQLITDQIDQLEAIQAVEDHKNEIAREVAQEYDNGDDQDEGLEYLKTGADANEAEHRDIELSQRGWDEYYQ